MNSYPRHRLTLLLILLLIAARHLISPAQAYEVDNFTNRDQIQRDSLTIMDQKVNRIMELAIRETRKEDPGSCNKAKLRQEFLSWIRPDPTGQLEVWLETSSQIDRAEIGIRKSIYQNVSFLDAPILNVVGIGRSIRLAGQIVGSDKIGHFFMQGLEFYDLEREGKSIDRILREDHGEDGVWGLATSGVYSYADIAADYQGYRFWKEFTTGDHPYIRCDEEKGWVKNRDFTWASYVNPAWDEAINCSGMRPKIQASVDAYLAKKGIQCPVDPEACVKVVAIENAEYFTSPKCQAAAQAQGKAKPLAAF